LPDQDENKANPATSKSPSPQAKEAESVASDESRAMALAIAAAGLEKKATAIEIIDVSGKVDYTDFLVLMSGRGDRHVHAIAKGIERNIKTKRKTAPLSVEGLSAAQWVLIDFNDVVVHVFQSDARYYYDLEGLWIDASRVLLPTPNERKR
jgi:ribosome-associated protein